MRLCCLLAQHGFDVHFLILYLEAEDLMGVVDVLVDEWVLEHLRGGHLDEEVPCHVVREVGHDDGAPASLLDRAAVHF